MGMCCERKIMIVHKCMGYEVKGFRPRGRKKRIWKEVVQKDCQAYKFDRQE